MFIFRFHGTNTNRIVQLLRLAFSCRIGCSCEELVAFDVPFGAAVKKMTAHVDQSCFLSDGLLAHSVVKL